ncbi:hypothetical protein OsJ_25555 [Oryza sativa Japonica Group]|uniref:Uncharacterized protein n=1 Tax=Oryza sativa subsp. japonica TaxID=39947 RepID=B9FUU8_ORYSJ|nr:hypothetical protein OsJ_25555 [Oryza sativa Japonica Group]
MGYVPCNNGTSMKSGSAPGFPTAVRGGRRGGGGGGERDDGRQGVFRMAMNTTAALSSVASGCSLVVTRRWRRATRRSRRRGRSSPASGSSSAWSSSRVASPTSFDLFVWVPWSIALRAVSIYA